MSFKKKIALPVTALFFDKIFDTYNGITNYVVV